MRRYAGLGLEPLLLALAGACSSATPPSPIVLVHPPADPGGPPPDPASADKVSVYAVRHLWLGDVDPVTGKPSTQAWKSLGFDIDGKDTTRASRDVCMLAPGASWDAQDDGAGGIDNSFGENLVPSAELIFRGISTGGAADGISSGALTNLVVVHGLGSGGTAAPLSASLVVAAPLGATPSWSGADVWPVDSSSLANGDPSSPLLAFPGSFEDDRVLVAEPPSAGGEIALGVGDGTHYVLPIRHVQIAMTLSADGTTATNGVLSGVLPGDRIVELFQQLSERVSTGLCSSSAFASIAQQLQEMQDILLDGTNGPGAPCDGISIGLGFDAVRAQLGPVTEVAPLGDLCPPEDGGT